LISVAKDKKAETHVCAKRINTIHTDLQGAYQQLNMSTVLKSVEVLKQQGWNLPNSKVTEGLNHVQELTGMMGRYQTISRKPRIIVDSAHNPKGIDALLDNLKDEKYKELHVVIGMVTDKDVDAVLSMMPLGATYYFCQAKVLRALSCDLLGQQGMRLGLVGECHGSVKAALTAAKEAAKPEDLILVTGSVFVVAEVL
jgi:dihydrofolate synthase/folylpolyglutamate synthase